MRTVGLKIKPEKGKKPSKEKPEVTSDATKKKQEKPEE